MKLTRLWENTLLLQGCGWAFNFASAAYLNIWWFTLMVILGFLLVGTTCVHDGVLARMFIECCTEPYFHLAGYMERFRVWSRENRAVRPYVTLHHILRSDNARAEHSHPWKWYLSIVLLDGYWEWTLQYDRHGNYLGERRKWYGPGSIIFRRVSHYHRLELPASTTVWTLFITGPWCEDWKFMKDPVNKIAVPHWEYPEGSFEETK